MDFIEFRLMLAQRLLTAGNRTFPNLYIHLRENPGGIEKIRINGHSLLHEAAACGCVEAIPWLRSLGHTDMDIRDNNGRTPLMIAIGNQQDDFALAMTRFPLDVNLTDDYGFDACYEAVHRGSDKIIRRLIDLGADINRPYNSRTLLSRSIIEQREYMNRDILFKWGGHRSLTIGSTVVGEITYPLRNSIKMLTYSGGVANGIFDAILEAHIQFHIPIPDLEECVAEASKNRTNWWIKSQLKALISLGCEGGLDNDCPGGPDMRGSPQREKGYCWWCFLSEPYQQKLATLRERYYFGSSLTALLTM